MILDELKEKIEARELVTVGAASSLTNLSRNEIIKFVEANDLKIYDEEKGIWYNETAEGHC